MNSTNFAGDPRVHKILDELRELHDKKQQDYGTDGDPLANLRGAADWGIPPWKLCLARMGDKVKRLQKVAKGGTLVNEGVIDSFNDLAIYAILARVLWEEDNV